ncbi:chromate transporter [Bacillaceae bacterium Marseille-Q3522]|nr:chromate transporter [Bacillaceae bacterium Marseille-Q3522]
MRKVKQLDIFIAFFRSGMLGYGGGPSAIPLVYKEVVDTYKWMDSDEFGDILALANALPGPINTKMAGYIGYRLSGIPGMLIALVASVVPTVVLLIVLLTALNSYKDQPWVQGMTAAVVPVVAVMLAVMTWDFIKKSARSQLKWVWTAVLLLASLVLLEVAHIHPAILIFVLLVGALVIKDKKEKEKERE